MNSLHHSQLISRKKLPIVLINALSINFVIVRLNSIEMNLNYMYNYCEHIVSRTSSSVKAKSRIVV